MAAAHIHSGSVEEVSVQSLSKRCIELIASGFSDISETESPCKRTGRVNACFCSDVLQKHSKGLLHERNGGGLFFFYWELLKLKIPIYSHFPLEVCWGWLIPLLWYANGQLAFLRGTLEGVQGTQRRCPVRRAARLPPLLLGQRWEPSLCFGLKIKYLC